MLNVNPCPHCGHAEEMTHWNPPGTLALVDSDIIIKVPAGTVDFHTDGEESGIFESDTVVLARRTKYLQDKQGEMEYQLVELGTLVVGKFHWTHA